MATPNQYFLLADHIKLSLLERQRAISLNLEPTSQDGHISRSLDSLREGLENVRRERLRLEEAGDASASSAILENENKLQTQYNDLSAQFRGTPTDTASATISQPNDSSLSEDFARASGRPQLTSSSSFLKKSLRGSSSATNSPKSVRFSDHPSVQDEDAVRNALFPYRDDPNPTPPDQSHLDNQQIHAYHSQVLADQDEQLERLGESIGRQRELSIQIGDELDEHVQILDHMDGNVERHTTTLNKARKNLGSVARKAKDNMQLTIILILIIILVLLIIILK